MANANNDIAAEILTEMRDISFVATLSNKVPRISDENIPPSQPAPKHLKTLRGLKSTEEQNCFPRNRTCQKKLARIFPNALIVA